MYAGLIPIITKDVGQAKILEENGLNELILKNNKPKTIVEKILEIDNKSLAWKRKISRKCREIASRYTKEKQMKKFRDAFIRLIELL